MSDVVAARGTAENYIPSTEYVNPVLGSDPGNASSRGQPPRTGRCTVRDLWNATSMSGAGALARGRDAFEREAWSEAYEQLLAANNAALLAPEDLDLLATSAFLVGEDTACIDTLT